MELQQIHGELNLIFKSVIATVSKTKGYWCPPGCAPLELEPLVYDLKAIQDKIVRGLDEVNSLIDGLRKTVDGIDECPSGDSGNIIPEDHSEVEVSDRMDTLPVNLLELAPTKSMPSNQFDYGLSDEVALDLFQLVYGPQVAQIVSKLGAAQKAITVEVINRWKWTQLYNINIVWPWPNCPIVQAWLEQLVDHSLWLYAAARTNENEKSLKKLLCEIFNDTFVVVCCPRFSLYNSDRSRLNVKCIHLLSKYVLVARREQNNGPVATISLLNQNQAESAQNGKQDSTVCSFYIDQPLTTEVREADGCLVLSFGNALVKSQGCKRKKPSKDIKVVMSEKYFIRCRMTVTIRDVKLKSKYEWEVTCLSLPLTIGSHGNQRSDAMAAILIENAGFSSAQNHLTGPRKVRCVEVLEALNRMHIAYMAMWAKDEGGVKSLAKVNIQCLAEALREIATNRLGFGQRTVSASQLVHKSESSGSFWDFWYGFLDIVPNFKNLWVNSVVVPWIKREHLHMLLKDKEVGTVLIRPSLRMPGVVVSWKHSDGKVHSLYPWTKEDLNMRGLSLGERVNMLSTELEFSKIYPDRPLSVLNDPSCAHPFEFPELPDTHFKITISYALAVLKLQVDIPQ